MQVLLFFAFPALLFGLVALAIWLTVREKRQFDAQVVAAVSPAEVAGVPRGEAGLPEASDTLVPAQKVAFQTFVGHRDPVRQGKGAVAVEAGALVLTGRRHRLFAWRREVEVIPLSAVCDVIVSGRVLRFAQAGRALKAPRLLRLASAEAAASLAAALPSRMSEAGAVLKAETEAYQRFLAGGRPWVTLAIMAVNLAIWAWAGSRGAGWFQAKAGTLLELGGNLGPVTVQGQWQRLLVAVFLHAGFVHVAMNMPALWEAGRVSERLFGHARYLGLYLATGVIASIASINWKQDVVSVGASGAVFGVYGVLMAALALRPDLLPASATRRLRNGALVFVVYSLLHSLGQTGIDHAAHIGGLFAGMLLGAAATLPRDKAITAVAVTAFLAFLGVGRAYQVNAPYADEGAFRAYLPQVFEEEARLDRLAGVRESRNDFQTVAPDELVRLFESQLIPGWQAVAERLAGMPKLLPKTREIRDPLYAYARLKHEALVMFRDSLVRNDETLARRADERMREARHEAGRVQEIFFRIAARAAPPTPQGPAAQPTVGSSARNAR